MTEIRTGKEEQEPFLSQQKTSISGSKTAGVLLIA